MRVLKFGGTSVANAQRFQDVAEIALDTAKRSQTALVLSAPAKITNLLVALVAQGAAGKDGSEEFAQIRAIVEPIITTLGSKYEFQMLSAVKSGQTLTVFTAVIQE